MASNVNAVKLRTPQLSMKINFKETDGENENSVMTRSGDSVCIGEEEFDNLFIKEDAKDTGKPTLKPFNAKGNTTLHTSMAAERVIEVPWDVAHRASCHLLKRQAFQRLIGDRIIVGVKLKPLKKYYEGRIIPDAPCIQCCRYRMKEIPNQHSKN